ncbi:MAG: DUF488 domain-containing protein [Acidimicrobiia bacterium]|nr:DUF488 domain-containing protein [Acidimicrobiia bacterium]
MAEVLALHGVATIIDVRSHPYSRHAPQFSRPVLDGLAAASGFGYRWMGDALGGRPDDPALLRADGSLDGEALRRSPRFRAALVDVVTLAQGGGVALLCAEEQPQHCHRSRIIAPALGEMGVTVLHLFHDGSASAHQDSLGI